MNFEQFCVRQNELCDWALVKSQDSVIFAVVFLVTFMFFLSHQGFQSAPLAIFIPNFPSSILTSLFIAPFTRPCFYSQLFFSVRAQIKLFCLFIVSHFSSSNHFRPPFSFPKLSFPLTAHQKSCLLSSFYRGILSLSLLSSGHD